MSLLTQALKVLPASTDVAVERSRSDRGISNGEEGQPPSDWLVERRACEGCPPRSVGRALLQTTMINVFYGAANLIRGQVTAEITPKTWWANMEHGWVWDLDDFEVNQIGHPYQGNNYFTSGRANGLSFYESAALTAFGSGTWEYFGETNLPSVNDFVNTTLGGIALGEMFHRTAWLVRDTRATGRGRLWREIGATVLDPVTGYNRFRSGDANRVTDKPADMVPSMLEGFTSAGVLWRGSETRAIDAAGQPFFEVDLLYGDPRTGHTRTPYDAFAVRLRFGGGSRFSEARVRGRLLGQPLGSGKTQFTVLQSYDYQSNDAYATGAQSFEAALGVTRAAVVAERCLVLGMGRPDRVGRRRFSSAWRHRGPGRRAGAWARRRAGGLGGSALLRLRPGLDLWRGRGLLPRSSYFRHSPLRGPSSLLAGWCPREPLPAAGRLDLLLPLRGPFGIGASGEYFFSSELLPGRRIARSWSITTPSSACLSRGPSSERAVADGTPLRRAAWLARAVRGRRAICAAGPTDDGAG